MRRRPRQQLFLTVDQIARAERRQLESMSMRDGIGRARLHAISAENTSIVVYVVDLGVTFGSGDALLFRVFGGFDVNAVCRTRGCAQKTSDTFLQAIFVALQHVLTAEALLELR